MEWIKFDKGLVIPSFTKWKRMERKSKEFEDG